MCVCVILWIDSFFPPNIAFPLSYCIGLYDVFRLFVCCFLSFSNDCTFVKSFSNCILFAGDLVCFCFYPKIVTYKCFTFNHFVFICVTVNCVAKCSFACEWQFAINVVFFCIQIINKVEVYGTSPCACLCECERCRTHALACLLPFLLHIV